MLEIKNIKESAGALLEDNSSAITFTMDATKQDLERKLIRDSSYYFLSKAIPGLMGLFSVLAFVRMVGNAEYGRYSVLFAIITACTAGLSGWLPQGILRYFSMSHTELEVNHFKLATLVGALLSILVGTLVLGCALWFERQPFWSSLLGVLLLAAGMLYGIFLIELQAMLKSKDVAFVEAIRAISCFVVPVCLILLTGKRSAGVLLAGVAVGYILPLMIAGPNGHGRSHVLRTALSAPSWKNEFRVLRTIWTYGWPVGIWSMCLTLQSAIDRFFIQHYSGDAKAGSYAALYDVIVRSFSLLCFPLVMSSNSLVMDRWNKGDRRGAVSLVQSSFKYQLMISLLFLLALALLAQQVSHLILGGKYELSVSLVLPLAVGGFLWQIAYLVHKPLELMFLTKRMLIAMMVALVVSVSGNYLFIPVYGYVAAAYVAIAAPLAYLLAAVILIPFAQFRREITVRGASLVSRRDQ